MAIEVTSIGSSSSGNSYIIRTSSSTLILDVGLTMKRIIGALNDSGISPEDVKAVMLTHEHVDHVRSVRAIGRKCCNAVVLASRGTARHTPYFDSIPEERVMLVGAGEIVELGDVTVKVFSLSHDASEPVGFSVEADGEVLTIVTDTGIITDEIYAAIRESDLLVLEANHDEELLMFGEYPYSLKVRIKGDHGHLSNKTAGEVLAQALADTGRKPDIMLAHLSEHNNAPFYARYTIEGILQENGFVRDEDYTLTIAGKDDICIMGRTLR